jgi:hypothetical protein
MVGRRPRLFRRGRCHVHGRSLGAAIDCLAVFKDTGTPSNMNLLLYIDCFTFTPNGGDITIQWQNSVPWIAKL